MEQSWDEMYKNMWDARYKSEEYAYGKEPNNFFREWLQKFTPGSILLPADGEGRNGVFAAQSGWKTTSFDLSVEGKLKAMNLAKEKNVLINYIVGDLEELDFEPGSFDAIGLIYAHFAAGKKMSFHKKLNSWLKPGGIIILEAFSKHHLVLKMQDPTLGGPGEIEMLYSEDEIRTSFKNYEILKLVEEEINLEAGKYHSGRGSVLRFIGKKLP
jgi:SAM-dependent methyltransferase